MKLVGSAKDLKPESLIELRRTGAGGPQAGNFKTT